jgi:hypothetical protein
MDEIEHLHLTVQTTHDDARMLVKLLKSEEEKNRTNLKIVMGNQRRFGAFLKLDKIYRESLGPAVQQIYDICFDEIAPAES